jgi:phospholipid/cholesterol/gamma-HCH transport system substrate-binding protein
MKKELTKEIKVGMMVVAAILILLIFFFKMGKFDFSKKGYEVKAIFDFASGITKNATVRVLGIEVGKVEKVDLEFGEQTKVILTLWVDQSTRLKADSKAIITTSGLMGGSHVELYPGTKDAPPLEPGTILEGQDPLHNLMQTFTEKGESLVKELEVALTNITSLTGNVDGMVTENRDEVNKILQNVEVTTENLKELSTDLKRNPWKIITKPKDWKSKM